MADVPPAARHALSVVREFPLMSVASEHTILALVFVSS
jgi:hypothetical protein